MPVINLTRKPDRYCGVRIEDSKVHGPTDLVDLGIPAEYVRGAWGDHETHLMRNWYIVFQDDGEYYLFDNRADMEEVFNHVGANGSPGGP